MHRVLLLGGATVEGPNGRVVSRGAQRARIALFALLIGSARRSASRDRLTAILWPESDTDRARANLRDSVYRLRETLGESAVVAVGDELRIDLAHVRCDVCDFEDAVARNELEAADRLYSGPFLDGFYLAGSAEFERWVDAERIRLAEMHAKVLESIARQCREHGDLSGAVAAWRRRAHFDPYNSRVALRVVEALDAAGDRAGALHHAAAYAALLKTEFGAEPDADIEALATRLREEPSQHGAGKIRRPSFGPPLHPDRDNQPAALRTDALESASHAQNRGLKTPARLFSAAAVFLAAILLAAVSRVWNPDPSEPVLDPDMIVVVPFRVNAPDSSYNYLREGIVDVVSAQLTGNGLPRAIDTRAVMRTYRRDIRNNEGTELTAEQSVALARDLGAAQVILGEFTATAKGAAISARLLSVPSGRIVADHSENGDGDEIDLIARLSERLLAKSLGEAATRISGLSNSREAVRAYLAGMRAHRTGQPRVAFEQFGKALDLDPTFAPAALWRAYVSWGAFMFAAPEKGRADSVAWSLRHRLGRPDSVALASLASIGPNWPQPSTAAELIQALEHAAQRNPDRPEIWYAWARHLEAWGLQAGVPDHFALAVIADDSAIALDSSFVPAVRHRLYLAVLQRDTSAVRTLAALHSRTNADSSRAALIDWMVARALNDRARLPALLHRLAISSGYVWGNVETWSVFYGLSSLQEADYAARARLAHYAGDPGERKEAMRSLFRIAVLRGRPSLALAIADSLGRDRPHHALIEFALTGPGYDSAAWAAVRFLESISDTVKSRKIAAEDLCYTQMWRVTRGDTMGARVAIGQMKQLVGILEPSGSQVGRLSLCPALLEAAVAQRSSSETRTQALHNVANLLLRGTLAEVSYNFAKLLVARWLEAEGDPSAALELIRRMDPMASVTVGPAAFVLEGRLARKLGDRKSAVRAYGRFLSLRPAPDFGPLAHEAAVIRREIAELNTGRSWGFGRYR